MTVDRSSDVYDDNGFSYSAGEVAPIMLSLIMYTVVFSLTWC